MGSSASSPVAVVPGLKEKQAADEQAHRQALNDLHRYLEDPEDLEMLNLKHSPLIAPEGGFRVELGGSSSDQVTSPVLEEVEKHSLYYRTNFCNKVHFNYVGGNPANPLVLSLVQLDKHKDKFNFSLLLRTKKDDFIYSFAAKDRKAALKHASATMTDLQGQEALALVKDQKSLSDELSHMEDRMLIKAYRVGVVYAGLSVDENTMFSNTEPSEGFKTFMSWIGKHIKLKGYKGFKGGLDVEHNTTGTHSYVTDCQGFDIMFHVSTELPFSTLNPQQVERKRHIGNDVVVIVYQDGPTAKPFTASSITSKFNHVYIVVQAIPPPTTNGATKNASSGTTASTAKSTANPSSSTPNGKSRPSRGASKRKNTVEIETDALASTSASTAASVGGKPGEKLQYRVAVVSKHGVQPHGPVLPDPDHIWSLDDTFRNFLLTKIVNAERAAYYAPGFGQARTRRLWLKSLVEKYGPAPKGGATNRPNTLDG